MKLSFKTISLILSLLMVICGTVMVAYASPDGGDQAEVGADVAVADDGVDIAADSGDAAVDDAPADEGIGISSDNAVIDAPAEESGDDIAAEPDPAEVVDSEPVDTPEDTPAETPVDTPDDSAQTSEYDSAQVVNEPAEPAAQDTYEEPQYTYEEDPIWYGDASNYDYNTTEDTDQNSGAVSDYAELYNSAGMSDADVAANDWSDVTLDQKTTGTGDGRGSFSAIKDDRGSDDNGAWILILGYILIGLSVLGILYFIVTTVAQRKANKKAAGAPAAAASAHEGSAERRERSGRHTGHYSDGFDDYSSRSSRRASKEDTAEIYIPKRVK